MEPETCILLFTGRLVLMKRLHKDREAIMATRKPQSVLSNRGDGYDVQFEVMRSGAFICRKCCYHIMRGDARLYRAALAVKHLVCHEEDGHRIDPNAMNVLRSKL